MYSTHIALALLLPWSTFAQSATAPLTNPTSIPCPSGVTLVRSAGATENQSLSSSETSYVSNRTSNVLPGAWATYFKNVNSTSSTSLPSYVSGILMNSSNGSFPKLGIAVSGGGYRATIFGAGALSSLDARNMTAANKTGTGGLLQAATYLAGLSGGSWLVTALSQANFPTIADLVFPPEAQANASASGNTTTAYGGFNAQVALTNPGPNAQGTAAYLQMLIEEVRAKHDVSGLPITITDLWSRALSRHFVNGTTAQNVLSPGLHGAGVLFSDIASLPSFKSHGQPFPIIVADSFSPNPNRSEVIPEQPVPLTNEIWEFNVYETGSFDPNLSSFIPTALLGSTNSSHCMAGFDQAAYVTGISSNVFPAGNISEAAMQSPSTNVLIDLINSAFPRQGVRLDSAAVPNPFQGVNPSTYSNTNETYVALLDGGLDGQVIPLQPLLVRARGVDTIIAIDASADEEDNFTNGTEIITSARRASLFGTTYPFPSVPATPEIFLSQNLTLRPTFFGCNDSSDVPLIIYIANGGPPASGGAPVTNTSTGKTEYSSQEVRAFLDQAFEISTQGAPVSGNKTDSEWGACLACAVVDRARARTGAQRDGICNTCFQRYCWIGNDTTMTVGGSGSGGGSGSSNSAVGLVGASAFLTTLIGVGLGVGMVDVL